jgi:ectoine hydroxylase-related dioxygenase (phytanoyl-CoA dioxygenase family)
MSEDLSNFTGLLTDEFRRGQIADQPVSTEHLAAFERDGFMSGITILSDVQIELLRKDLIELMSPNDEQRALFYEYHHNESTDADRVLFHALGAWRVSRAFHDLVFHRPIIAMAEQLLGGPVRFWHDQLFVKPARDGAVVAWHQDYSYWTRTKPVAHLTCWIGLDDSTEENGCVHYVPGSHKWNLLPRTDLANDMNAVLDVLTPEQSEQFNPIPMILKAGQASFPHPMMRHGSYENRSDRPRRAAVINFIRDGVVSDSDEPLLAGVPVIATGDKIEGRFFPRLSSNS